MARAVTITPGSITSDQVLGPFRRGRVLRGLHVATVGSGDYFELYGVAICSHWVPSVAEIEGSGVGVERLFAHWDSGFELGQSFAGFGYGSIAVPVPCSLFVPLQVEFEADSWLVFAAQLINGAVGSVVTIAPAFSFGGSRERRRRSF